MKLIMNEPKDIDTTMLMDMLTDIDYTYRYVHSCLFQLITNMLTLLITNMLMDVLPDTDRNYANGY